MVDVDFIRRVAAEKGVPEIVVEKDYILDWVLWGVSQIPNLKQNLVFKGGTALHKIYFPDWRFSEDLDFTTIYRIRNQALTTLVSELCKLIQKESGIQLSLKGIEATGEKNEDWSFEIKLEYIGPRKQAGGSLPTVIIHITNDELLVHRPYAKQLLAPFPDINPFFSLLTYSPEEIFAEKLRTVLHQRCWPRDVYDLWRLFKEIGNFVDIDKVFHTYVRKCSYRDFEPYIPQDFDDRFLRLKNQWGQGLQRQIKNVPDFDVVYGETKEMIANLFNSIESKKGGATMIEIEYRLRYKKGDLEVEVQGDKDFVESKFQELISLGTPALPTVSVTKTMPSLPEGKKPSLAEFVKVKSPKTHGDRMLVFGYYLEKFEGAFAFNIDDINKCYQAARTPKTKNFRQYIGQLISQGYIMDAPEKKDNKKAWMLTGSGSEYVEGLGPAKEG